MVTDGTDRFDAAAATDGLLGLPRSQSQTRDIDFAFVRRQLAPRLATDSRPPEYLRINLDMGQKVVIRALAWAIAMHGMYPTITLHRQVLPPPEGPVAGSNDASFFLDQEISIPNRTNMGVYTRNEHQLQHGAALLWQMNVNVACSTWTQAELDGGTADIYLTRFSALPRHTRLYSNGKISGATAFTGWDTADTTPNKTPRAFEAYQYYALSVSVGLLVGSDPLSLEIQELQPLVEAPAASTSTSADLYGREILPPGSGWYKIVVNRDLPVTVRNTLLPNIGYIEIWDSFKVRSAFHQGVTWSAFSFPSQPGVTPGQGRRASVSLSEVLVPRFVPIRSTNASIAAVPFVWCFVRHRAMQPIGDQSIIVNRLVDPDRILEPHLQPPSWTTGREAIWFQLTIPSARIPGESQYIGLASSNVVQVLVTDTIGSALPEFCIVLPSGEVVDFIQYDGNILADEVCQDEWASINAMLTVQFEEPPPQKKQRTSNLN